MSNYKERQREIKLIVKNALQEIKEYSKSPDQVIELANFMAQFPQYSLRNVSLIRHQFKGATAVAGYKELLQKGFPVRKGEQGIRILAPTVCQYILDEKGNRKSKSRWNKEEKELISKGKVAVKEDVYYRSVFVFNISQTNAQSKDLPQIFPNRPYNYDYSNVKNRQNLYEELVRIAKETGIDIRIEKVSEWQNKKLGSAKGGFMQSGKDKTILLSPRLNDDEMIPVLIHELTHSILHNKQRQEERDKPLNRVQKEFQAELSSYIIAKHYGIDTASQAIPYISNWTDNLKQITDEDQLRDINEVQKLSRNITNQIDMRLYGQQELKEKNKSYQDFKELVEKAKNADIIKVIENAGYSLKKESRKQYRGIEHDSLVVDVAKNRYYFNSRNEKGDPINFVQKIVGIDNFKQAVNYINGLKVNIKQISNEVEDKTPFKYDEKQEVKDVSRTRDYLINKRGIDKYVVDVFINKGLIRQDKRKNVLFVWQNQSGTIKGCSEQGTIYTNKLKRGYWKRVQPRSSKGHGFNYLQGKPENLKFFESPIDLLSYISINRGKGKLDNTWLISMDGLKDEVLNFYFKEAANQTNIKSFNLCVDNDISGKKFAEKYTKFEFQQGLNRVPIEHEIPEKPFEVDKNKWDWNDERKYQIDQQTSIKTNKIILKRKLEAFMKKNKVNVQTPKEKNKEESEQFQHVEMRIRR